MATLDGRVAVSDAEQPWGADVGGAEAFVAELQAGGGRAAVVHADFGDPDAPARVMGAARAAFEHDGRPGGRIVLFTSGQYHGAMPGQLPHISSRPAANLVASRLSDDAAWITGRTIASDGGWSGR